ncbi:hypothetical protein ICN48_06655 [Polynucleobacter sp. JS-Safj-400b-B2]|uniref:hypothetical protein n=1 Tax=Polynucleobacter sp. JS-Safj-400b-B2 TaxID=2576921 RepID=UPI001C0CA5EA|nr:hypothetical protein [Polynucleobacter sp. JS-Safj-400b-B2]MBU3625913.1 hypothetical protein [Polynucleobacter sp. JS-Safj-400b-B2]
MGREVRRVKKDWQHPKDRDGRYLPLYDGAEFSERAARWDEGAQKWAEGLRLDPQGNWISLTEDQRGKPYSSWDGERPDPKDYMPLWSDNERTYLMMYENTSEGTPISPAFATAEELACWFDQRRKAGVRLRQADMHGADMLFSECDIEEVKELKAA